MKTIANIKNICKFTALVSFTIGTILVILFAMNKAQDSLIIIGFYYIFIAVMLNSILLFCVFISVLYFSQHRQELLAHCGLVLLNIPVALGYFFLVLNLSGL